MVTDWISSFHIYKVWYTLVAGSTFVVPKGVDVLRATPYISGFGTQHVEESHMKV